MHTTPVHIERNRINRNYNVLLLLLPALVFGLILSFYAIRRSAIESRQFSRDQNSATLGQETELDK